ncbi:MAG: TspO/MBR family protein [Planctomycetota bacterium]
MSSAVKIETRAMGSCGSHPAIWFSASFALLALGGWLTSIGLGDWYDTLDFPPYQPPGWAFTPAWVIILSLLAWSTWRISQKFEDGFHSFLPLAYLLYGVQFALNVGWSLLFFAVRRPDAALWEILVLDAVLLAMVLVYGKIDRQAGWMLVPYLAWLLFATAINAWISMHNGPFVLACPLGPIHLMS